MAKALSERKINLGQSRLVEYLRDTWFEVKKVSWPTRSQAVNLTIMVIIMTTFLSIVLSLMDFGFSRVFGLII